MINKSHIEVEDVNQKKRCSLDDVGYSIIYDVVSLGILLL